MEQSTEQEEQALAAYSEKLLNDAVCTPTLFTLGGYARLLSDGGKVAESLPFYARMVAFMSSTYAQTPPSLQMPYAHLRCWYASALEATGDLLGAAQMYEEVLRDRPSDSLALGNLALLTHRRLRKFSQAERLYQSAIEGHPDHASIICKYAGFVKTVKGDMALAEQLYRRAIAVNPEHAESLAAFLHGVKSADSASHEEADELYRKAIKLDPTNINTISNYGLFLCDVQKKYDEAEQMYIRAITSDSMHANSLYNYAVLLDSHTGRREEAQALYRRAVDANPTHPFALYNLAVSIEEIGASVQEAQQFFARAAEAAPDDVNTIADYGRFLLNTVGDVDKAEKFLRRALTLDTSCAVALLNLSITLQRYRKQPREAEAAVRQLLDAQPSHPQALGIDLARPADQVVAYFIQSLNSCADASVANDLCRYALTANRTAPGGRVAASTALNFLNTLVHERGQRSPSAARVRACDGKKSPSKRHNVVEQWPVVEERVLMLKSALARGVI